MCIPNRNKVITWKFLTEDKEIFATHRVNQDCLFKCCYCQSLPFALCVGQCADWCAYLGDRSTAVYTEDLFSADLENPVVIGRVISTYHIRPVPVTCGLSTYKQLSRVAVRAFDVPDPAISLQTRKNLSPILSTHAYLQGGVMCVSPCSMLCSPIIGKNVMRVPSGTCCDIGRHSTVQRMTFEDAVSMDAGAPGTTILDTKLQPTMPMSAPVIGQQPKGIE